jgi:hypothetical protein
MGLLGLGLVAAGLGLACWQRSGCLPAQIASRLTEVGPGGADPTPAGATARPSRTPRPSLTPTASQTPRPTPTLRPSATPSHTPAATATQPASPTPSPSATACLDDSDFVADITIPDGTRLVAGTAFTKTWRVRNAGTCLWGSGYAWVFLEGAQLDGPGALPLPRVVLPGEEVDISVPLRAPALPGAYSGRWRLRNGAGETLGTRPFVSIVVVAAGGGATAPPSGSEPNLGTLRLTASLTAIRQVGAGQCALDFLLHATGGTGQYSYYWDKDVEDPQFKIVDRHPGDFTYTQTRANGWGGPVGFIVWSGFTRPQRATASVWVDAAQVKCP